MAEVLLIENLKELYNAIDQQHLLYLEFGENPLKSDPRSKLESYIKEYLCLAPHDSKFTFHQTADVLHKSVSTKSNFSAYKAAAAWRAIGKYADNLITHPWRKEYRNIKLYCGFYKHEIEESLVEAELMFEAMGYRHAGHSSMTLPGILDPDRITSVSKDAIIAYVECQIMKQIWETLSPHFQITWLEILEFRENHPGSPEQVIRALTYKYRQKQYQEQIYYRSQQMRSLESQLPPDSLYRYPTMGYYNPMPYPSNQYSFPAQNRYNTMISPTQALPQYNLYSSDIPPQYSSNLSKMQDPYSMNGYHMHAHYPPQNSYGHNGYCIVPATYPSQSIVPTGQLIELDSSPTHNGGVNYSQQVNLSKYESNQDQLVYQDTLKLEGPSLSEKAKDDGAGSWENWDYVYRNLGTQGYSKSFESTSESLLRGNQQTSSQNNSSDIDIDSVIKSDFSDKMRKMNLNKYSKEQSESSSYRGKSDTETKLKSLKVKPKAEQCRDPSKTKTDNKSAKPSSEKMKKEQVKQVFESNFSGGNQKVDVDGPLPKDSIKLKKPKENVKPLVVSLDEEEEKWQCVTCTYLNSLNSTVCQMCYKSKERGCELTPQPSGGQVCPKCTLVNEPGLTTCAACNESLKDSPTYI